MLVDSFEKDQNNENNYLVVLIPNKKGTIWSDEQRCRKITIKGEYDQLRWSKYGAFLSRENHNKLVTLLSDSVGKSITFGVMGNGLKKIKDCHFLSKGLFGNAENNDVMSVYDRI